MLQQRCSQAKEKQHEELLKRNKQNLYYWPNAPRCTYISLSLLNRTTDAAPTSSPPPTRPLAHTARPFARPTPTYVRCASTLTLSILQVCHLIQVFLFLIYCDSYVDPDWLISIRIQQVRAPPPLWWALFSMATWTPGRASAYPQGQIDIRIKIKN